MCRILLIFNTCTFVVAEFVFFYYGLFLAFLSQVILFLCKQIFYNKIFYASKKTCTYCIIICHTF